jgi:uncharacterized tellurite resistance protein B-like protein
MPNSNVVKRLAKVMVAAAWADGTITNEEINCLKDLLFHLQGMTAGDWAEIDIYIESPVDEAERARLVEELRAALTTQAEKAEALQALDHLVQVGGEIGEAEKSVVAEIKSAIQEANTGFTSHLGRLIHGQTQKRSQALASAPNRELYLDDFVKNRIYYDMSRRLAAEGTPLDISEADLRKLSLAGGLMARIASVDNHVVAGEQELMSQALQQLWSLSAAEATLVTEVAVADISKGMDYFRLCREFFTSTTADERVHFLDVLFAVAAADGLATFNEIEEIRTIANGLKLTHQQFIDAKLRIPRAQRVD